MNLLRFSVSIKPELLEKRQGKKSYANFIHIFPDNKIPVCEAVPVFVVPPNEAVASGLCPEDYLGFRLDTSRLTPEQYLTLYKLFFGDKTEEELGSGFGNQGNPLRIVRINFRDVLAVFTEEVAEPLENTLKLDSRGFTFGDLECRHGALCRIQESASGTEEAIWLIAHPDSPERTSVELTRFNAAQLAVWLHHFALTGELPVPNPGDRT